MSWDGDWSIVGKGLLYFFLWAFCSFVVVWIMQAIMRYLGKTKEEYPIEANWEPVFWAGPVLALVIWGSYTKGAEIVTAWMEQNEKEEAKKTAE